MKPSIHKVVAFTCCLVALAIALSVLLEALRISGLDDESLASELRGAAYEDVLGFSFWPTLAVTSIVVLSLLITSWVLVRTKFFRGVIVLVLIGFAIVTVFSHHSLGRVERQWSSKSRGANDIELRPSPFYLPRRFV